MWRSATNWRYIRSNIADASGVIFKGKRCNSSNSSSKEPRVAGNDSALFAPPSLAE
jgi:hypothetical protein